MNVEDFKEISGVHLRHNGAYSFRLCNQIFSYKASLAKEILFKSENILVDMCNSADKDVNPQTLVTYACDLANVLVAEFYKRDWMLPSEHIVETGYGTDAMDEKVKEFGGEINASNT